MLLLLLRASRAIDGMTERVGEAVRWLVLVAVLVSAGNAVARYALDSGSNAWLELQWYLFSALFLLCAGYTLLRDEHVRVDILLTLLPPRARACVDIAGCVLFLLPTSVLLTVLAWPGFVEALVRGEVSGDAGGLIRWPVRLLIPLGFALLSLQGISEISKRLAFLRGLITDPARRAGERPAPPPVDPS